MNHQPPTQPTALLPELVAELTRIREARAFNAENWLTAKVDLIAGYLRDNGLRGAVLGMSGGIDSAVVLGLLLQVKKHYPAVLPKVVALIMPVHVKEATGQARAEQRAQGLCIKWNAEYKAIDLTKVHAGYRERIDGQFPYARDGWAAGQLVSTIRTPALYYATSLLTAARFPSLVVGTTNRDEGAYLGYVGKASDGMVDLQVIADLHKSEVRAVAFRLGVTQEILAIAPTGDMFDGRTDEQVFGASYDFVELYLAHLYRNDSLKGLWSKSAQDQYDRLAANLEALHIHNAHKYKVGSPAVHLNVMESAVPGGWSK